MKKFLLIIAVLFLLGCERESISEGEISPMIVISIEKTGNPEVVQYKVSNSRDFMGFDIRYFNDSISKFNVGDRIEFVKK